MKEELERWYKKLWETKGSRFAAANRLELHEKWSTITITLLSVYIICINLLVLFPDRCRSTYSDLNITYFTICFSVFILAVSLIISSRNYKIRADKFHECGRRIDEVYVKVCLWRNLEISPSIYEFEKMCEMYQNVLDKYENHTSIDYLLFKANNLSEYKKIEKKKWFLIRIKFWFFLQTSGVYIIVLSIPLWLTIIL